MMHLLLRNLIRLALRVYFRKVYILQEAITKADKPVILAANHPNGIMDVLVMAALLSKSNYYFLLPSDIMKGSWKSILLQWLNCIPAERGEDKLSMQTLGKCSDIMKNKGRLVVFTEEKSNQAKRLPSISNDVSSIALDVEESYGFGLDTLVVPVALNYTYFNLFRSELMISMANPVVMAEFKNIFQQDKPQAFSVLNEKISKGITEEMVVIAEEQHEIVTERLLTINRNDCEIPSIPWKSRQQDKLRFEQIITGFANDFSTNNASILMGLSQKCSDYFGQMASFGINDRELSSSHSANIFNILSTVLLLPVFCVGYIANIFPVWITDITSKASVEDITWHEANRLLKGTVLWITYYSIITAVVFVMGGPVAGSITAVLVPLSGYISLYYRELGNSILGKVRYWMAKTSKPELIVSLQSQREEIIQMMIRKPAKKPVAGINITKNLHVN